MDNQRVKRTKIDMEPTAMDIETRYKRKAEVLDELIELTPMEIDTPVFYPPLVRADANALDAMDN